MRAKQTKHHARKHFLERPRNKVGGALLFFVASRDLWWGRACVLQNMVEWRVLQLWGRACVLQICISGVRVTNLGVLQIV